MSLEPVSVIVPAYNCEKTISQCLSAIVNQDYMGTIEIVVVDDGSTDSTARIIKSFMNIHYIRQENAGPAAARNCGAKNARHEYLVFTDADCVPENDWLNKLMTPFEGPGVAVVSGSYGIANPEVLLARCVHAEIKYRHLSRMPENPNSFGSYNFGIRRKVFEELGGFDPGYRFASGEDNDLSYKLVKAGHKIRFNKVALVKHFHPERLGKYLAEQYRHGFWRVKMYLDHPIMSRGDDYTFWKDIIEIPLVLVIVSAPFFSNVFQYSPQLSLTSLLALVALELIFGFLVMKNPAESVFWGLVTFFRAWARTAGFIVGLFCFLLQKSSKKTK